MCQHGARQHARTGRGSPRAGTWPGATPPARSAGVVLFALLAALLAATTGGEAQEAGEAATVTGVVISAETGEPVPGATVRVRGTPLGALSGDGGRFRIADVPAGTRVLEASATGFRSVTRELELADGDTGEVEFRLPVRPLEMGGIEVSVLRPDLQPQAELTEREVREANPKDSGELLRQLPGVDAVRRGPLGLDPSVRGLRETEVGTYIDGTRMFPAGPARMDSPLTHVDPSTISDIQVVKGPYALTWGAGNMSAVRVETRQLPDAEGTGGRLSAGYDTNLDAAETAASVSGREGRVSYWAHGAWRDGDDYESGGDPGTAIPGDYRSWEVRGKAGVDLTEDSQLVLSGGFQDQGPIDYPGRLLDAELFETVNTSARWTLERDDGTLRSLEVMGYYNDVHHEMTNDGKPTAEPMEGRTPPFALDVGVDSDMAVAGGRVDAELAPGADWELEVGGDLYSADRDAVRTIRRRQDGTVLFEDLMWPDATITDVGAFVRASRDFAGGVRASGTVRADVVEARADSASEFFRENVGGDLDASEAHLSGALTVGTDVSPHLTLSAGLGTVVRTADATERYSDRIPATKAQTSAEFVGSPDLEPERSNQADLWIDGSWEKLALNVNVFGRTMDDYITLEPTDLEKRLPLSPDTVFRYVNGEATFWGFEASAGVGLTDALTLEAGTAYLRGEDETLDEPALGVHPWRGSLGLRYESPGGRFFAEGTATGVTEQDRVAATRGETPTDGHVTAELRGGVQVVGGLNLRVGVENVADEDYVNHLNAKNPFTGRALPEPGRVFFADATYAF